MEEVSAGSIPRGIGRATTALTHRPPRPGGLQRLAGPDATHSIPDSVALAQSQIVGYAGASMPTRDSPLRAETPPPSSRWLWPLPIFALVIYLATWSAVHSWDSIAYTARAHDDPLLSEVFLSTSWLHPHHLLFLPLAWLFVQLTGWASSDPFAPLLLLSTLSGAGCVALGGWLAFRAAGARAAGLAAAGLLTFANTTWLYSTLVEVMMPALFFLLLGGALLVSRNRAGAVGAGLAVALGVLVHQIGVLYAVAWTVALALARDRRSLTFVAAWIVPVGLTYVAASILYAGAGSVPEIFNWAVAAGSRSEGAAAGVLAAGYEAARTAAEGLVTLVPVTRIRAGTARDGLTILGAIAALLVLVGAGTAFARVWRRSAGVGSTAEEAAKPVMSGLLGGSLLSALFIAWYQARTLDYWVYVIAGLGIWVCGRSPRLAAAPFAIWLILLAGVNYGFRVLPMRGAANAPYADFSRFASRHMMPGDRLWLGPGDEGLEHALVVLPFFYGVEVDRLGPLTEAAREHRSDRRRRSSLPPARDGRVFATESALAWLRGDSQGGAADSIGTLRATRIYLVRSESP